MRIFKVPFDLKREEKIFGGYLSLRQVIYLMLSASSLSVLATTLPIPIKIIIISVVSIFFMLLNMPFVKKSIYMRGVANDSYDYIFSFKCIVHNWNCYLC